MSLGLNKISVYLTYTAYLTIVKKLLQKYWLIGKMKSGRMSIK